MIAPLAGRTGVSQLRAANTEFIFLLYDNSYKLTTALRHL